MLATASARSPFRSVARNSFWMSLSVGIGIVQGVAVTYVMSRSLGLVAFGQLGLIISCTSVLLFASGSVVPNVLRESARGRLDGSALVVGAMFAQLLLAVPVLLAALVVLWLVSGDAALLGPAALLGIALLARTALGPLVGLHLGRERMEWQLLDSAQLVLAFAALLGLVTLRTGLYALPLASLVGAGGVGVAALAVLGRRGLPGRVWPQPAVVRMLAASTLLWGAVNMAQQVQWSLEPLLAPVIMDAREVGLFIAGGRLLPGIRSLAAALGLVCLPPFVRAVAAADWSRLSDDAQRLLRYILPGGFVLTLGLFTCSDAIVRVLYPQGFEAAAIILRRLSVNLIPMLLHWEALCLLFAADKPRELLAGYGVALVIRLVLAVRLGSTHGGVGLATAQVASDWIMALTLQVIAVRALRLKYGRALARSALCAGIALATLVLASSASVVFAAGSALAVFALTWTINEALMATAPE